MMQHEYKDTHIRRVYFITKLAYAHHIHSPHMLKAPIPSLHSKPYTAPYFYPVLKTVKDTKYDIF